MTAEKRILISPKDILSIGFECPHCGATYFVPIEKLDRPWRQCPNCQESLATDASVPNSDYSDVKVLFLFVDFLRQVRSRAFGAFLRFEVKGELITPSGVQRSEPGQ
jgi:transcription elongation factor Elf1